MRFAPVILAAAIALTGCASTKVAVFDGETNEGGTKNPTGAVAVINEKTGTDARVLDQADSLTAARKGKAKAKRTDSGKLQKRYGALLASLPPPPVHFSVILKRDSVEPEDPAALDILLDLVKSRPGADITIVGHTDTQGDGPYNDELSVERARSIQNLLVSKGYSADIIRATGRGERELQVMTADNIAEPLNRRVEVIVR